MALVSSGALHSCEDHLQYPRSVSAARLESLAFMQAQNGNASNSSVLPIATSCIFSLLSLSSDFSRPFATGEGKFLCLAPLHIYPIFLPLLSAGNLPYSPSLSQSCFYHHIFLPPPPQTPSFYSLHCIKTSKIFEGSLLLLTSFSASTCECLFSVFFCHLFPSVSRQWSEPGQGASGVMEKRKKIWSPVGQILASVNKTYIYCMFSGFVLSQLLLLNNSGVSCAIKQPCLFPAKHNPSCTHKL